ncbi:RNA polymerase sigma factor [Halobacillus litoralis]|uniref:RNA polymerase sigma factor n=1 Tax=Halobacillus litoralis TaxID=45668 RepID=UPI001CD372C1|nr:RNA polymerase sigma factor [Halobacillus litoralis]MCA0971416.1 RNA polymerase sigma factor [Halobacillus litoralis]
MKKEKRLIKDIQKQSSRKSADELIHLYYKEMFAYAYKQLYEKELAKDITQEIFISMLRNIHRFDGRSSFRTWLYKIAKSRIVDYYRSKQYKQRQQGELLIDEAIAETHDFTAQMETRAEAQRALDLLSTFEPGSEKIVRMKLLAERTFEDISTVLNENESTVKTKYYRTMKQLKDLLKEEQ